VAVGWDGERYHRVSGPMEAMGVAVLERLELEGDEIVLDAGCGTGRVTAHLATRVPGGRIYAVDRDPSMVAEARGHLAGLGHRVVVLEADLLELELPEPVDAVLSTATFHWIPDHDRLFRRLAALLRPGGRLVAQCGGRGNIDRVLAAAASAMDEPPFAGRFDGWARGSYFAGPDETVARLHEAGFVEARCWLEERPIRPADPVEYLSTVTLRDHLAVLPPEARRTFAERAAERLGEPVVLDYVRLNIDARRELD
jgi:trans-aconitate 2-methyltransferase